MSFAFALDFGCGLTPDIKLSKSAEDGFGSGLNTLQTGTLPPCPNQKNIFTWCEAGSL